MTMFPIKCLTNLFTKPERLTVRFYLDIIIVNLIYLKAMLKQIVDFATLLIGAEGVRLLREKQVLGDPTGALRRGGSRTARGKRAPGAEINRQV